MTLEQLLEQQYENAYKAFMDNELNEMFSDLSKGQGKLAKATSLFEAALDLEARMNNLNEDTNPMEELLGASNELFKYSMELFKSGNDSLAKAREITNSYKPETGKVEITKLTDRKLGNGLMFAIETLIKWVKNTIQVFIQKLINIVASMFGVKIAKAKDKTGKDLSKTYKGLFQMLQDPKDKKSLATKLVGVESGKLEKYKILKVSQDEMEQLAGILNEGFDVYTEGAILNEDTEEEKKKYQHIVQIDTSKDLDNLNSVLKRFFDLFDNSFGSEDEYLFGTKDLSLLLTNFQRTYEEIIDGRVSAFEIAGRSVSNGIIDENKIKQSLIATNTNIRTLSNIYQDASKNVANVANIIGHKNLIGSGTLGNSFKFLSISSYKQLAELQGIVASREKAGIKLHKDLEKVEKQYTQLTDQLTRIRSAMGTNLGNVAYAPVYQKRLVSLFTSVKYVSEIISLRLSGLSIYLKEVQEIRALIESLTRLTRVDFKVAKKQMKALGATDRIAKRF